MKAIEVSGVEKRYGALRALDGVTLAVEQGEFFGLLGPNGAGKTTLINVIAGLARADAGSVRVMGADVSADYRRARRMLGVVPQELVFDPFFTVRETLRLQSGYFGIRANDAWIDEIMAHLDLAAKADVNMRALSGGMKRRVLVAQALVHKPPVIVLDEPTAGVDVELRQGLWQFVRRLNRDGHTIVLTTHYLEEAELHCSRIALLKAGRIAALDSTRNLLDMFSGVELRLRLDRESLPAAFPGKLVSFDKSFFVVKLEDYGQLEDALVSLRQAGVKIREMELQPPDLEEVFVRLTGRGS
ncbi:MAG TPA: ABC transporter ATP-binding protein [Burkholderiales bacterium]|nr:ABC transporter ATP-binding protein [Burkholderiales bacterium]